MIKLIRQHESKEIYRMDIIPTIAFLHRSLTCFLIIILTFFHPLLQNGLLARIITL